MPHLIWYILRRSARSLWENLYLNVASTVVIGLAILLVAIFATFMYNLNSIVQDWQQDVHISAYFRPDIPVERRFEIKDSIASMDQVSKVRYVSEEDAQAYLEEHVPEVAPVLDELGAGVLPSSLEITLVDAYIQSGELQEIAQRITRPEFQDLDYGQQWVERFNSFLSLLKLLGILLGSILLFSTLFLVGNTINLVVLNRRTELETMRLVGATNTFITAPFLVEGLVQGIVGAGLAIGALLVIHKSLVLRLQDALRLTTAQDPLQMLPPGPILLFVLMGAMLGMLGAALAVRKFLGNAP